MRSSTPSNRLSDRQLTLLISVKKRIFELIEMDLKNLRSHNTASLYFTIQYPEGVDPFKYHEQFCQKLRSTLNDTNTLTLNWIAIHQAIALLNGKSQNNTVLEIMALKSSIEETLKTFGELIFSVGKIHKVKFYKFNNPLRHERYNYFQDWLKEKMPVELYRAIFDNSNPSTQKLFEYCLIEMMVRYLQTQFNNKGVGATREEDIIKENASILRFMSGFSLDSDPKLICDFFKTTCQYVNISFNSMLHASVPALGRGAISSDEKKSKVEMPVLSVNVAEMQEAVTKHWESLIRFLGNLHAEPRVLERKKRKNIDVIALQIKGFITQINEFDPSTEEGGRQIMSMLHSLLTSPINSAVSLIPHSVQKVIASYDAACLKPKAEKLGVASSTQQALFSANNNDDDNEPPPIFPGTARPNKTM